MRFVLKKILIIEKLFLSSSEKTDQILDVDRAWRNGVSF